MGLEPPGRGGLCARLGPAAGRVCVSVFELHPPPHPGVTRLALGRDVWILGSWSWGGVWVSQLLAFQQQCCLTHRGDPGVIVWAPPPPSPGLATRILRATSCWHRLCARCQASLPRELAPYPWRLCS